MTVTMKTIPTIISALKKRKAPALVKDSEKPLSSKEAVILLAPALLTKKEEGFTAAELADFLAEHGIIVKPHNLTRYMREYSAASTGQESEDKSKSPPPSASFGS